MKISKIALLVVLSMILLYGCNPSAENAEAVDYAALEELPVEMVMEIGESESYLPGRIAYLEVMEDGTMLVGDWGSTTIEQFNSEGEYVGMVARAGRGPGELGEYFSIHTLGGDTLISRNLLAEKNYYTRTGGELFEHVETIVRNESLNQRFYIQGAVAKNKFYAILDKIIPTQKAAKDPRPYIEEAFVVVDAEENVLEDSVHVLKRSNDFVVDMGGGRYMHSIVPYRIDDLVVMLEEGNYLIARPDSSAFFVYNRDHELDRRISFRVKERPVTSEDLESVLEGRPAEIQSEVENATPDVKPPYRGIFASENYLWLLTDESDAGKEVVVVDFEGEPAGKFMLSEYDGIRHVEDDRIYTVHDNPDMGNVIRIYEVDI